jgi:excisionase family DNA binding protein
MATKTPHLTFPGSISLEHAGEPSPENAAAEIRDLVATLNARSPTVLLGIVREIQARFAHEYLRPSEAAAYLKSSASTLAKRRLNGGGPRFTRIGRAVRYRRSDLDDFMAASLRRTTFDAAAP